mmetsp:Transcript_14549/g.58079  ORF Transcript_14549/g.58079 Transcript_14549/m.58079 type:complete len:435 (+) Transcript_14549:1735-3039(+)
MADGVQSERERARRVAVRVEAQPREPRQQERCREGIERPPVERRRRRRRRRVLRDHRHDVVDDAPRVVAAARRWSSRRDERAAGVRVVPREEDAPRREPARGVVVGAAVRRRARAVDARARRSPGQRRRRAEVGKIGRLARRVHKKPGRRRRRRVVTSGMRRSGRRSSCPRRSSSSSSEGRVGVLLARHDEVDLVAEPEVGILGRAVLGVVVVAPRGGVDLVLVPREEPVEPVQRLEWVIVEVRRHGRRLGAVPREFRPLEERRFGEGRVGVGRGVRRRRRRRQCRRRRVGDGPRRRGRLEQKAEEAVVVIHGAQLLGARGGARGGVGRFFRLEERVQERRRERDGERVPGEASHDGVRRGGRDERVGRHSGAPRGLGVGRSPRELGRAVQQKRRGGARFERLQFDDALRHRRRPAEARALGAREHDAGLRRSR